MEELAGVVGASALNANALDSLHIVCGRNSSNCGSKI
jgi:hypothetical protein